MTAEVCYMKDMLFGLPAGLIAGAVVGFLFPLSGMLA